MPQTCVAFWAFEKFQKIGMFNMPILSRGHDMRCIFVSDWIVWVLMNPLSGYITCLASILTFKFLNKKCLILPKKWFSDIYSTSNMYNSLRKYHSRVKFQKQMSPKCSIHGFNTCTYCVKIEYLGPARFQRFTKEKAWKIHVIWSGGS